MIASFMERYTTPAGLDGVSPEEFLAAYARSVGDRRATAAAGAESWRHRGGS